LRGGLLGIGGKEKPRAIERKIEKDLRKERSAKRTGRARTPAKPGNLYRAHERPSVYCVKKRNPRGRKISHPHGKSIDSVSLRSYYPHQAIPGGKMRKGRFRETQ